MQVEDTTPTGNAVGMPVQGTARADSVAAGSTAEVSGNACIRIEPSPYADAPPGDVWFVNLNDGRVVGVNEGTTVSPRVFKAVAQS